VYYTHICAWGPEGYDDEKNEDPIDCTYMLNITSNVFNLT